MLEKVDERHMSQVNVTINGRQYRMACEDGQEDHLQQLAKDLDERIDRAARPVRRDRRRAADRHGGADGRRRTGRNRARISKRLEEDYAAPCRTRAARPLNERRRHRPRSWPRSMPRPSASRAWPTSSARAAPRRAAASHMADSLRFQRMAGSRRLHPHYIALAGLRGATEHIPRGLTILKGAVPGRDPWVRTYGAHLLM